MTLDEAQKIAAIIGTADNGCSVCVGSLVEKLNEAFPNFSWVAGETIEPDEENDWSMAKHVEVVQLSTHEQEPAQTKSATQRETLSGKAIENGLEQHSIPFLTDLVIAKPGTIQMETSLLHDGQTILRRLWRVDGGTETLIAEHMCHT